MGAVYGLLRLAQLRHMGWHIFSTAALATCTAIIVLNHCWALWTLDGCGQKTSGKPRPGAASKAVQPEHALNSLRQRQRLHGVGSRLGLGALPPCLHPASAASGGVAQQPCEPRTPVPPPLSTGWGFWPMLPMLRALLPRDLDTEEAVSEHMLLSHIWLARSLHLSPAAWNAAFMRAHVVPLQEFATVHGYATVHRSFGPAHVCRLLVFVHEGGTLTTCLLQRPRAAILVRCQQLLPRFVAFELVLFRVPGMRKMLFAHATFDRFGLRLNEPQRAAVLALLNGLNGMSEPALRTLRVASFLEDPVFQTTGSLAAQRKQQSPQSLIGDLL